MREDILFLYICGAALVAALWYVARFVVLWYFRIDRIIELLEKIAGEERPRSTLHMTESGEIAEGTTAHHH